MKILRILLLSSLLILNIAIIAQDTSSDLADDNEQLKKFISTEDSGKTYLNSKERDLLFYLASQNRVADLGMLKKYDPQEFIGFCFGRSMSVYLSARSIGLSKESIKEIFVIGDLRSGPDPEWRFHVATIVKGDNEQWHAVDPLLGRVQSLKQWVNTIHKVWDKKKVAKFYITSPSAVLPDLSEFHPVTSEADHMILDILFNPLAHEGFTPHKIKNVYTVSPEAEVKYFSTIHEDEESRFNFLEIKIESDIVSFNNYFTDLMLTFDKASIEKLKNDFQKKSDLGANDRKDALLNLNMGLNMSLDLKSMRFKR